MHVIWMVLIGFVAGLIAKAIMPGENNPSGFFMTAAIGIAGSIAATYLGHLVGWYEEGSSAGFIGAIVGAMILLGTYHLATKK
ncbi:GlsB/YeaQ/YmgE family stress response membrane protein [Undibacterium sp. RuRC25W]|uniref:GlsB/YeaQ/YmgE family stress response membrane protein n=1 Tax=Undibacterium sp. RuRC25W TaxID=3413047 RepID=UPI003BF1E226